MSTYTHPNPCATVPHPPVKWRCDVCGYPNETPRKWRS